MYEQSDFALKRLKEEKDSLAHAKVRFDLESNDLKRRELEQKGLGLDEKARSEEDLNGRGPSTGQAFSEMAANFSGQGRMAPAPDQSGEANIFAKLNAPQFQDEPPNPYQGLSKPFALAANQQASPYKGIGVAQPAPVDQDYGDPMELYKLGEAMFKDPNSTEEERTEGQELMRTAMEKQDVLNNLGQEGDGTEEEITRRNEDGSIIEDENRQSINFEDMDVEGEQPLDLEGGSSAEEDLLKLQENVFDEDGNMNEPPTLGVPSKPTSEPATPSFGVGDPKFEELVWQRYAAGMAAQAGGGFGGSKMAENADKALLDYVKSTDPKSKGLTAYQLLSIKNKEREWNRKLGLDNVKRGDRAVNEGRKDDEIDRSNLELVYKTTQTMQKDFDTGIGSKRASAKDVGSLVSKVLRNANFGEVNFKITGETAENYKYEKGSYGISKVINEKALTPILTNIVRLFGDDKPSGPDVQHVKTWEHLMGVVRRWQAFIAGSGNVNIPVSQLRGLFSALNGAVITSASKAKDKISAFDGNLAAKKILNLLPGALESVRNIGATKVLQMFKIGTELSHINLNFYSQDKFGFVGRDPLGGKKPPKYQEHTGRIMNFKGRLASDAISQHLNVLLNQPDLFNITAQEKRDIFAANNRPSIQRLAKVLANRIPNVDPILRELYAKKIERLAELGKVADSGKVDKYGKKIFLDASGETFRDPKKRSEYLKILSFVANEASWS